MDQIITTSRDHSCRKSKCYYCNRNDKAKAIKPIWEIIPGVSVITDHKEKILEAIYLRECPKN